LSGRAPLVSILLPCRDAAAWLPECIASLEAQTVGDFEVLAIDDGSRDDTPALLEAWSARDARVRVERTEPRGLVAALMGGLARARGELVARMDADDVAHPARLERQIRLLHDEQLDACGCAVRYFPRAAVRDGARAYERWINGLVQPHEIARDVFVECPIPHPTLLARRSALAAAGGYRDAGWAEDYDLVLRLWAGGFRLGKAAEILLAWRERPDRLSRTDARYDAASFRRCKIHFLERTFLRDRPGVVMCGAGPVGKAFARDLLAAGFRIEAFCELHPRRLGQRIHGAPVIPYAALGGPDGAFAFAAVAGDGPRAAIRATLEAKGWVEGRNFCAVG
jgi:glycosyltransferase involved in cell wall biosynthesis